MVGLTTNDSWYDHTYISVAVEAGSEIQLRTKTTSLNITGGNFDVESTETFGGSIKRTSAREDIEIAFEGIATSLQDFDWIFHGVSNTLSQITSSAIEDYRVTLLWTDESGITSAAQAIATASEAYREIYAECNLVSLEKSQNADENLTAALTFKTAFEDASGSINFKKQMCGTASAMAAVSAYTSTTKF